MWPLPTAALFNFEWCRPIYQVKKPSRSSRLAGNWQHTDIDLENKQKKKVKVWKKGNWIGSTRANYNVMKAREKSLLPSSLFTRSCRNLDCKQRKDLKLDGQKRCHLPLGRSCRSISPLQLRQTMRCFSSLIAYWGSANHLGRFFFSFLSFFFLLLATEAHKKVIMEEKWDLAQWITACNIDLFERRITLGFPLVGLMNRILIWCPLIKSWDYRQQPAPSWRPRHPFWTRRDTCDCGAVPYAPRWTQTSGAQGPYASNMKGPCLAATTGWCCWATKLCCEPVCGFEGGQISPKKAETRPMIWHKAVTLLGFVVNHNAAPQCRKRPLVPLLFACYCPQY